MKNKLAAMAAIATILAGSAATSVDATATYVPQGYITLLSGGWVDPHLRINLDSANFYNPENCLNHDGYVIPANLPANQLLSSLVLTAYSTHKQVTLTVDGCYLDRPKVVGVTVTG